MWNRIPRVLRIGLLCVVIGTTAGASLSLTWRTASAVAPPSNRPVIQTTEDLLQAPLPQTSAACGDVVINEVLFRPADPPDDEWVELYVVNELEQNTEIRVSDLETSGGQFTLEFTLTAAVPGNRYIVVHGNAEADSQEPTIGYANFFEAGNGSDLANGGDNLALYINGVACEEVQWGSFSDDPGNPDDTSGAPVVLTFGSTGSISAGESIQRSPNGATGQFVRGATAGQYNAAEGHNIGRNNLDGTLAVTMGFFRATLAEGNGADSLVHFQWQTVSETGTAGFRLLGEADGMRTPLHEELIPSTVIDSITPTDYEFLAQTEAEQFYLSEVDVDGAVQEHGPFALGETYGTPTTAAAPPPAGNLTERPLFLPLIRR